MLIEKLKQKSYYLNKFTLFLRNSHGIEDQVELLWKILIDCDSTIDEVFKAISLNEEVDVDDTLDKIAEIVGTKRNLSVKYEVGGVETTFDLSLTNEELIRVISTKIIQNNYNGTYLEFIKSYQRIGLDMYVYDNVESNVMSIVLNENLNLTDNDKHLFLSGHYTIRSLGIRYTYSIQEITALGIWSLSTWDLAEWGV
jgi:hypothetical protein